MQAPISSTETWRPSHRKPVCADRLAEAAAVAGHRPRHSLLPAQPRPASRAGCRAGIGAHASSTRSLLTSSPKHCTSPINRSSAALAACRRRREQRLIAPPRPYDCKCTPPCASRRSPDPWRSTNAGRRVRDCGVASRVPVSGGSWATAGLQRRPSPERTRRRRNRSHASFSRSSLLAASLDRRDARSAALRDASERSDDRNGDGDMMISASWSFRRLQHAAAGALGDAALELGAEVLDQALDRPGGGVAQRADGVAFDLLGDVEQLVDRRRRRRRLRAAAPSSATSSRCLRGTACTGRSSHACRSRRCG